MDNVVTGQFGATKSQYRPCRVSYTLDYDQPVICTHISDQPFFYFEDEIIEEEDDGALMIALDDKDLLAMEQELADLKAQIERFDRDYEENFGSTPCGLSALFTQNAHVFEWYNHEDKNSHDVIDILKQSRTAASYLDFMNDKDIQIVFCHQEYNASYNADEKVIIINDSLGFEEKILLTASKLRKVWQTQQGAYQDPMSLAPDDAILVNRLQHADAAICMVRVAWELQLAGHRDVWTFLEGSSMGDLARAKAREAHTDFRALNDGRSYTAAFEAWFLSERCRQADTKLIRAMLGRHTESSDATAHSRNENFSLYAYIAKLGEMPFGKNYLIPHIEIIAEDDIFKSVRDRSNANFLWFIKFEQSFQETQDYLHTGHISSDFARTADPKSNFTSEHSDAGQSACDIIHLFPTPSDFERGRGSKRQSAQDVSVETRSSPAARPFSGKVRTSADIIDLSARF